VTGSLQLTGSFSQIGLSAKSALELWQDRVNELSLGYAVELTLADCGDNISRAVEIAAYDSRNDSVHVIIAPYTSAASLKVVQAVAGAKPVLVWGGAAQAIFETSNKKVFGFFTPASKYMATGLDALYTKGARTLSLWRDDRLFSKEVCDGAVEHAKNLGMTLTGSSSAATGTKAILPVENSSVDVAVICGHADLVWNLTMTMANSSFKYKMLLATQVGDPAFRKGIARAGLQIDDGMMMPTQWARSDKWKERDPVTGWSSEDFISAFILTHGSAPTYHAASAAAAGIALSLAINAAGGVTDMEAVAQAMYALDANTFYGPIAFSKSGAPRGKPMLTMQNLPNMTSKVVAPPEMKEAELVYPISDSPANSQSAMLHWAPWPSLVLLLPMLTRRN
jgi:branched-chain amino acid transport system substrate-binding protein